MPGIAAEIYRHVIGLVRAFRVIWKEGMEEESRGKEEVPIKAIQYGRK